MAGCSGLSQQSGHRGPPQRVAWPSPGSRHRAMGLEGADHSGLGCYLCLLFISLLAERS